MIYAPCLVYLQYLLYLNLYVLCTVSVHNMDESLHFWILTVLPFDTYLESRLPHAETGDGLLYNEKML